MIKNKRIKTKTKTDKARDLCKQVMELANKAGLQFFFVTEGASCHSHSGNSPIVAATESHRKWELENGIDPHGTWGVESIMAFNCHACGKEWALRLEDPDIQEQPDGTSPPDGINRYAMCPNCGKNNDGRFTNTDECGYNIY